MSRRNIKEIVETEVPKIFCDLCDKQLTTGTTVIHLGVDEVISPQMVSMGPRSYIDICSIECMLGKSQALSIIMNIKLIPEISRYSKGEKSSYPVKDTSSFFAAQR